VRIGEEEVVYPTLILAALNGIKPERYKYRVDTTHSVSPAMQALMQQWQALREQPMPTRELPAGEVIEAESTPLKEPPAPRDRQQEWVFRSLDALNAIPKDPDDEGYDHDG
jgi:hypothetical protein